MPRFTSDQLAFAAAKQRYMARDEAIEFFETMQINYSVGHWSADELEAARRKGTGPDVLDIVSPVLVG